MDRSIKEIIVYWRKALAGGYHDSRLNASETGKLISEIERLERNFQTCREERQCLKSENGEAIKQLAENRIKTERLGELIESAYKEGHGDGWQNGNYLEDWEKSGTKCELEALKEK